MRMSRQFGKTLRNVPADADTPNHQLMLKAGLVQQLAAGIFSYLPTGWKVMRKIEQVIREEMDRIGAQAKKRYRCLATYRFSATCSATRSASATRPT